MRREAQADAARQLHVAGKDAACVAGTFLLEEIADTAVKLVQRFAGNWFFGRGIGGIHCGVRR